MAHTTEIMVNGILTQVTEFDHSAQEIDDAIDALGGAKTPQEALANLGAGVRPNLAQNGCFDIWQRGTTFDFSGGGDNIGPDRWTNGFQKVKYERVKNTSPANCEWMLRVTNASSDGVDAGGTVLQTVEEGIANETVTISFFVQSLKNTIQLAVDNSEPTPVGTDWTFVSITKKASSQRIGIGANLGSDLSSGYNITSIKIERGNIQTNAFKTLDGNWASLPQPDSKPGQMLAECQRYLYSPYYGAFPTAPIGTVFVSNQTTGFVVINTPALMRTKPVFSGDPSKLWIVKSNGGGAQRPSALSVMGMSGCGVFLSVTASFEGGGQYIMYSEDVSNPSDFLLSAEL